MRPRRHRHHEHTRTVIVGRGVSGAVLRGLPPSLEARAMFVLEKPQDAFFRLARGIEEHIPATFEDARARD